MPSGQKRGVFWGREAVKPSPPPPVLSGAQLHLDVNKLVLQNQCLRKPRPCAAGGATGDRTSSTSHRNLSLGRHLRGVGWEGGQTPPEGPRTQPAPVCPLTAGSSPCSPKPQTHHQPHPESEDPSGRGSQSLHRLSAQNEKEQRNRCGERASEDAAATHAAAESCCRRTIREHQAGLGRPAGP